MRACRQAGKQTNRLADCMPACRQAGKQTNRLADTGTHAGTHTDTYRHIQTHTDTYRAQIEVRERILVDELLQHNG